MIVRDSAGRYALGPKIPRHARTLKPRRSLPVNTEPVAQVVGGLPDGRLAWVNRITGRSMNTLTPVRAIRWGVVVAATQAEAFEEFRAGRVVDWLHPVCAEVTA